MKSNPSRSLSSSISLRFYAIIFLSNVGIIIAMFFLLRHQLQGKDQNIATVRFHEIARVIDSNGITALQTEAERGQFNELDDLLIVVRDAEGKKIYEHMPKKMDNFDLQDVEKQLEAGSKSNGIMTIYPKEMFEETVEIFSGDIANYRLIVGINTDSSEDFLHLYFKMSILATLFFTSISVILGYYFTKKALEPIGTLISTVKTVRSGQWKLIEHPVDGENELTELTNLFNEMLVQIQKLVLSLQTSLDSIAHDLRTPLTHISNKLEKFIRGNDNKVGVDIVGDIMEEIQAMSALVNSLLEITEADSKGLVLKRESFDLRKVIDECIEIYEYVIEEKNAQITVQCVENFIVVADKNKFKRVIANLLDNALKYSFEEPKILIECEKVADGFILSIEDEGIGIAEEDINRIWQRLYRGDRSRTTPGMGLGLSFVRSIVDAHGGSIILHRARPAGVKFSLFFPWTNLS